MTDTPMESGQPVAAGQFWASRYTGRPARRVEVVDTDGIDGGWARIAYLDSPGDELPLRWLSMQTVASQFALLHTSVAEAHARALAEDAARAAWAPQP